MRSDVNANENSWPITTLTVNKEGKFLSNASSRRDQEHFPILVGYKLGIIAYG